MGVYRKCPREWEVEVLGILLTREGAVMTFQKKLRQWSPPGHYCQTCFPLPLYLHKPNDKGSLGKKIEFGLNDNCLYFGVRGKPKEMTTFSFPRKLGVLNLYGNRRVLQILKLSKLVSVRFKFNAWFLFWAVVLIIILTRRTMASVFHCLRCEAFSHTSFNLENTPIWKNIISPIGQIWRQRFRKTKRLSW